MGENRSRAFVSSDLYASCLRLERSIDFLYGSLEPLLEHTTVI